MSGLVQISKVLEIIASYCPDDDGTCSKADRDLREMLDEIENMDEVDAVQVVRCEYCIFSRPDEYGLECMVHYRPTKEDDFCSYGEKYEMG